MTAVISDLENLEHKEAKNFNIPKKCLVTIPSFIGDAVLITPLLVNLRMNFGIEVQIDIVAKSGIAKLLKNNNFVNRVYSQEKISNNTKFLQKRGYDTILLFNFPFNWAFAAYCAKIPQRVGFSLDRLGIKPLRIWEKAITHIVQSTTISALQHQIEVYLNTLKDLGLKKFVIFPSININEKAVFKAKKLLNNIKNKTILIHATAGSIGKELDLKFWANTIKEISNIGGYEFICVGTEKDKHIYNKISQISEVKIHNFCGKTNLQETVGVLKEIDTVITLDTSIAHLAAVAETPNIIVIYGPTNEKKWKPMSKTSRVFQVYKDLQCRPCITRFCSNKECLNSINPSDITDIIKEIGLSANLS